MSLDQYLVMVVAVSLTAVVAYALGKEAERSAAAKRRGAGTHYTLQVLGTQYIDGIRISRECGSGIGDLVRGMIELGMAHHSVAPKLPADGHPGEVGRLLADHGSYGESRIAGIPSHKLGSDAGWHVTAEECGEAFTAFKRAIANGATVPAAFGSDFIDFLLHGMSRDGFRVI